ncbi:hypothetical protein [Endozoicomonas sp. ALB032]|uniref:hypothetical protein n=1 Tax=Endozoicomonas sp. ALB032 TaxID=3403082 RepID=UPI003BB6045C
MLGAFTIFIVHIIMIYGYSIMVVKIKNPYLMLVAAMAFLSYFALMSFDLEKYASVLGFYASELGNLLGVVLAVVTGGLASIALSEIRNRHLTKGSSSLRG